MDPGANIFREKSLEHISSPEQLTDYIKVSNPGVWLVLSAILVLLASVTAWAVLGRLPTTLTVNAYVENGSATCYVDEAMAARLKPGMTVRINGTVGAILRVSARPKSAAELREKYQDDYLEASLKAGDWNFAVESAAAGVPDGLYTLAMTLDSVKPISFLMN
jgi:hypothetical protein